MVNQSTEKKNTRQIQMTIEGHKVTISFAQEANPTLSALVRNTLLDAYIRKTGCAERNNLHRGTVKNSCRKTLDCRQQR